MRVWLKENTTGNCLHLSPIETYLWNHFLNFLHHYHLCVTQKSQPMAMEWMARLDCNSSIYRASSQLASRSQLVCIFLIFKHAPSCLCSCTVMYWIVLEMQFAIALSFVITAKQSNTQGNVTDEDSQNNRCGKTTTTTTKTKTTKKVRIVCMWIECIIHNKNMHKPLTIHTYTQSSTLSQSYDTNTPDCDEKIISFLYCCRFVRCFVCSSRIQYHFNKFYVSYSVLFSIPSAHSEWMHYRRVRSRKRHGKSKRRRKECSSNTRRIKRTQTI